MNQVLHGSRIAADIPVIKLNTSRREVGPRRVAGWSTRLSEESNFQVGHGLWNIVDS
jgi:hypothetical protein